MQQLCNMEQSKEITMATGYDVFTVKSGRIVVVLHPTCTISKQDILALLVEGGFDQSVVTFVEPANIIECGDLSGVPVIVPLDDAICDLPELESIGRQCGAADARVVILFGPECSYEGLHPIAEKYGTQCDWSADRIKGCVEGESEAPRDAAGERAQRSEAREVVCRR
jgi:hypothetical protein